MQIFPIIVIYCVDFHTTAAYQKLLSFYPECEFLLYDNSPTPINKKYESKWVHYVHNANNGGVSIAYNTGSKYALKANKSYLLLLDQDTSFNHIYLQILEQAISEYPDIHLFVPIIQYQSKRIFSPVQFSIFKVDGASISPGVYPLEKYLPVNSGVCIKNEYFIINGGYNEELKLDFADFDFFSRLRKYCSHFLLLDFTAIQSFSNDILDKDEARHRVVATDDGLLSVEREEGKEEEGKEEGLHDGRG